MPAIRARLSGVVLLALVLPLAGCAAEDPGLGLLATPEPLATEAPLVTEAPSPSAVPPVKDLPVRVTKKAGSVKPNSTASLTIKTTKGAECSIQVFYDTVVSTAKGLGDKKADGSGKVTWKWKVGSATHSGKWPIYITCTLKDREGTAETSITVK